MYAILTFQLSSVKFFPWPDVTKTAVERLVVGVGMNNDSIEAEIELGGNGEGEK